MNKILDTLTEIINDDAFVSFDQVALFGSALHTDVPNDIDILLVYSKALPEQVNMAKGRVEEILACRFPDSTLDFTTLSKAELLQTDFLMKVPHQKIKR